VSVDSFMKAMHVFSNQEKNTIIAALTFYMEKAQGEPSGRTDAIHALACGDGHKLDEDISMDEQGIADLIAKIAG